MLTILWNQFARVAVSPSGEAGGGMLVQRNQRRQRQEEEHRIRKARRDDVDMLEMCSMVTKIL